MDTIHREACSKVKGSQTPAEMYVDRWYHVRVKLWYNPFARLTLHLTIKNGVEASTSRRNPWGVKKR